MADTASNNYTQLAEIETRQASLRQTPNMGFSTTLQKGFHNVFRLLSNTAASAGYNVPGAAVIGSAVNGAGAISDVGATTTLAESGLNGGTGALSGSIGSSVIDRAQAGDASAQLMTTANRMQEMAQQFNIQYLILQQRSQSESRDSSAVSNVMKVRHDNVRNILSNMK